jgi:hypothetical protein
VVDFQRDRPEEKIRSNKGKTWNEALRNKRICPFQKKKKSLSLSPVVSIIFQDHVQSIFHSPPSGRQEIASSC